MEGTAVAKRMRLGELAVSRDFLTREELEDALRAQDELFQEGTDRLLGEILVEKGYIRPGHLDALLRAQEEAGKKRIGPYELLSRLGEGGMGAVYKARDGRSGGLVALKVLSRKLAQDEEFVKRFEREGRLGLKLDHPNVVRTLEFGEGEGPGGLSYRYVAMEYIEGPNVEKLLDARGRLPETEALEITLNVARGLAHAHDVGLIHRDIKPSNILLAEDGRILLADLGLARSMTGKGTTVTVAGTTVGTPQYISPEQARGTKDLDGRTDIYSLGATLYHMLTGEVPFEGGSPAVIVAKRLTGVPPDPRDIVPELSEEVCRLVEKMMARKRRYRHPHPLMLIEDIEGVLAGKGTESVSPEPSSVRSAEGVGRGKREGTRRPRARKRPGTVHAASRLAGRKRLVVLLGSGVLCALIVVGALFLTSGRETDLSPRTTRSSGVRARAAPTGLRELVFQEGDGGPYSETFDANLQEKYPDGVWDKQTTIRTGIKNGAMKNAIIRFTDFIGAEEGQLPYGAQVETATLELCAAYTVRGMEVSLYRLSETFFVADNAPSWIHCKPDVSWTVPGASYVSETERSREATPDDTHLIDDGYEWYAFDVTSTVQDYVNSPETNYGWVLDNPDVDPHQSFLSSDHDTVSQRPVLRVSYTVLPDITPPGVSIPTAETGQVSPAFAEPTRGASATGP